MDTDTEVCEQIFRWWSRFKLVINHMGNAKANYIMQEMRELHNERSLRFDVMSTDFMPSARLAEVRAAYGLEPIELYGDSVVERSARVELADYLLGQHLRRPTERRAWSQELLNAHRQRVGGAWRTVHTKSKKRKRQDTQA